jgi:hypothetical protein
LREGREGCGEVGRIVLPVVPVVDRGGRPHEIDEADQQFETGEVQIGARPVRARYCPVGDLVGANLSRCPRLITGIQASSMRLSMLKTGL